MLFTKILCPVRGCTKLLSLFAIVLVFTFPGLAYSATITGTLFEADGVTPVLGHGFNIRMNWTGGAKGASSGVNADGTFEVNIDPITAPATFYLQASVTQITDPPKNYIAEWWAAPQSVRDRSQAQGILIENDSDTITDINFQLDPGAIIEGKLYQSDGATLLAGVSSRIVVYQGGCDSLETFGPTTGRIDTSTATYKLLGMPAGTYYLRATTDSDENYLDEWWNQAGSVRSCEEGQSITVEVENTYTEKNFQLDAGGMISGAIFDYSDVPVSGLSLIRLYKGNCDTREHVRTSSSTANLYSVNKLNAGSYRIMASSPFETDEYASEWWNSASTDTAYSCAEADVITVSEGQTIINTDFHVGPGADWSGAFFKEDGVTPITSADFDNGSTFGGGIDLYIMPSDLANICSIPEDSIGDLSQKYYDLAQIEGNFDDGTYTFNNIAPGSYYMLARPWGKLTFSSGEFITLEPPFKSEWWSSPESVLNCADGQLITVTSSVDNQNNINFQLDAIDGDSFCFPVKSNSGNMAVICL